MTGGEVKHRVAHGVSLHNVSSVSLPATPFATVIQPVSQPYVLLFIALSPDPSCDPCFGEWDGL